MGTPTPGPFTAQIMRFYNWLVSSGQIVPGGGGFTPPVTIPNDTTIFKNPADLPLLVTTPGGELEALNGLVAGDYIRGTYSPGVNQGGGILPLAGGIGTGSGAGGDITFYVALPGASNGIVNEIVTAASGAADTEIGPYTVAAPEGGLLPGSVSIVDTPPTSPINGGDPAYFYYDGPGAASMYAEFVAANRPQVKVAGNAAAGIYTVTAINLINAGTALQVVVATVVTPVSTGTMQAWPPQTITDDGAGALIGAVGTNAPNTVNYATGEVAFSYAAPYVGNVVINYTNQRQNTLTQVGTISGATGAATFSASVPSGAVADQVLNVTDGTATAEVIASVNDIGPSEPFAALHGTNGVIETLLYVKHDGVYIDGTPGVSGTFLTADAKTVTVTKGIITGIV